MATTKICACQIPVSDKVSDNLKTAKEYITEAVELGADIVVLPEMFCCPYNNESFVKNAQFEGGEIWTAMRDCARSLKVNLIAGSMPEKTTDGKIFNTCFVFDDTGTQVARFRKIHLFDINVKGGQCFMESKTFSPGCEPVVVKLGGINVGIEICFDIRFPELSRYESQMGAEVIIIPAAFNMTTGPAHWEISLRTRALDNQVYTIACSPSRNVDSSYIAYGNSMASSPWGNILERLDEKPGILCVDISSEYEESIREQLPLIKSLRKDVYKLAN